MNSEVKAKWLKALRSGRYKQARHTLRSCTGGFCCLGVLSDLYIKEVGGSWEWDYDDTSTFGIVNEERNDFATTELPGFVMDWAGLKWINPQVHIASAAGNFVPVTLSELNDEGKSFNEIADLIEHQL